MIKALLILLILLVLLDAKALILITKNCFPSKLDHHSHKQTETNIHETKQSYN